MRKLLAQVLCLAILLLCSFTASAEQRVIVDQYDYNEANIKIAYPHFDGMDDTVVQDKLNNLMEDKAECYMHDMRAAINDAEGAGCNPAYLAGNMSWQVYYNDGNLLSISLKKYNYLGGAHGMTYLECYTFDLDTGRELSYNDLFAWDKQARDAACDKILQQVKLRNIHLFNVHEQEVTILAKKLHDDKYVPCYYLNSFRQPVIVFQLYEVAPYAAGILEFPLTDN